MRKIVLPNSLTLSTKKVQAIIQKMSTQTYKYNFVPLIRTRGLVFSVFLSSSTKKYKYKRFLKVRVQGRTNL